MTKNDSLLEEIEMISAYEVDEDQLFEHYKIMYGHKMEFLKKNYKWLNNPVLFDYRYPVAAVHENKVIGHLNFTPFMAIVGDETYPGSWGGDLSVLKPYRGCGIGMKLVVDYMGIQDFYFAFGNNNSMNMVKKRFGWAECYETFMHYFPLMPIKSKKIPAFLRSMGNVLIRSALKIKYATHSFPLSSVRMEKVNENNLSKLVTDREVLKNDTIYPDYNIQQLKWRLLDSPYADEYFIFDFSTINVSVLVKIYQIDGSKFMDLMRTPESISDENVVKVLATLIQWSLRNKIGVVRYYNSSPQLSALLKTNLKGSVKHPRCCYFSRIPEVNERMKTSKWRWEIIDSDFEKFYS